jgi:Flp pilus assembly pilin Flp
MNAQVITTEYTDQFPVQPWAAVVRTAAAAAAASEGEGDAGVGFVPDAPVRVRKQHDRGASAVEWVIITGIVVAIVVGVGVVIKGAISSKADQTSTDIQNANTSGGSNATTGQ